MNTFIYYSEFPTLTSSCIELYLITVYISDKNRYISNVSWCKGEKQLVFG